MIFIINYSFIFSRFPAILSFWGRSWAGLVSWPRSFSVDQKPGATLRQGVLELFGRWRFFFKEPGSYSNFEDTKCIKENQWGSILDDFGSNHWVPCPNWMVTVYSFNWHTLTVPILLNSCPMDRDSNEAAGRETHRQTDSAPTVKNRTPTGH